MDTELLSYRQVEQLTGLPVGTLYAMVAQQTIPHVRLGKRLVRFPKADLMAWLRQHTVSPRGGEAA